MRGIHRKFRLYATGSSDIHDPEKVLQCVSKINFCCGENWPPHAGLASRYQIPVGTRMRTSVQPTKK